MQKYQYIATSPRLPRHHPSSRGCSGQRRACLILLGVLVQQVICCPAGTLLAVLYILQEVTVPHTVQSKAVRPARLQLTDTDTVSALQYVTMRSRGAAKYPRRRPRAQLRRENRYSKEVPLHHCKSYSGIGPAPREGNKTSTLYPIPSRFPGIMI